MSRRGVALTPMETRRDVIVRTAVLADELGYVEETLRAAAPGAQRGGPKPNRGHLGGRAGGVGSRGLTSPVW